MTDAELEAWARKIVDKVRTHSPVEDSTVELTSAWIRDRDAARRLAGQANAVRSDAVLWLIGIDEKAGTVPGAPPEEVANWLPAVKKHFDGPAPELLHQLNIDVAGKTVVALLFDVRNTPYVVKGAGGEVTHEVPWREGTRTFSANREQLLRLLSRVQPPHAELGAVILAAQWSDAEAGYRFDWSLTMELHLVPVNEQALVIRYSDCQGKATFAGTGAVVEFTSAALLPEEGSSTVDKTNSQVVVRGPAALRLFSQRAGVVIQDRPVDNRHITLTLPIWRADSSLIVTADLQRQLGGQVGNMRWTNGRPIGVF